MKNTFHILKYVSTPWLAGRFWSQFMPHSIIKVPAKVRNYDGDMLLYERRKPLFFSSVEWYLKPIAKNFFTNIKLCGLVLLKSPGCGNNIDCVDSLSLGFFLLQKKLWYAESLLTDVSVRLSPSFTLRASLKRSSENKPKLYCCLGN